MALSEKDVGQIIILLQQINQKTEGVNEKLIELRVTSNAKLESVEQAISTEFDKLFGTYKGFSETMEKLGNDIHDLKNAQDHFKMYAQLTASLVGGILVTLIVELLLKIR